MQSRCFRAVCPQSRAFAAATSTAQLAQLPGPKPWPLVGNLFNGDISAAFQEGGLRPKYKEYGPIFKLSLPGAELVFLSDVDLAREVLKDKSASFTNGDVFRSVFGYFFPTSVIVVEGDQWKRVRRVIQRAIQGTRLSASLPPMRVVLGRATEKFLRVGEPLDVHRLAANVTLDTFGFWAYGVDFNTIGGENAHILSSCNAISEVLAKRMQNPMPVLWELPTAENRKAKEALAVLKKTAAKLLDERLDMDLEGEYQKDLLAAMVAASRAEDGAKGSMTRDELIDNIGTVFFGAYDTTSATIAFTLHFLATNPVAQDALASELSTVNLAEITRDELEALPYLDSVCRETHRLCSTASAVPRTAKEDVQLGPYAISRGTNVIVDHLSVTARDPKLWGGQQDLDTFRPERWSEMRPHRLANLPFGFGGRICPGNNLATLEHKFITASLVNSFAWTADTNRPAMETTTKVGLCPKDGCWLVPAPR